MNLSIIHYHLMPGGVTRIISSQIAALAGCPLFDGIEILCGLAPEDSGIGEVPIKKNEGLNYISSNDEKKYYIQLKDRLYDFIKEQTAGKDIIHIHNPNLGKNPVLTSVVRRLAENGYRLFLHCHDFAEDRPANIAFMRYVCENVFGERTRDVMYPQTDSCRYGVLNSFDADRLKAFGIDAEKIHRIPNPVYFRNHDEGEQKDAARDIVCSHLHCDPETRIVVYPVRVIRRKNIGELILFSAVLRGKASWLVTLAPHNPEEAGHYRKWKDFVRKMKLPVFFEAGRGLAFRTLMYGADICITTSIREGFGMSYLEPWLFGKQVAGRAIPYIVDDFREEGMIFDRLYDRIPVDRNGEERDFPSLSDDEQREYIMMVAGDKLKRERFAARTNIDAFILSPVSHETIVHNREIIEEKYSLEHYGKRLCGIYKTLSG
ncbi:MAG: glycosyltransferase family 4 protein [Spirochaetales bacterium]|nr:glycosyltransferase family 4 protein [Spirochaetales bacterium]